MFPLCLLRNYIIILINIVCELPGRDLVATWDDVAEDPRQGDGVLDVLGSLAKVGA